MEIMPWQKANWQKLTVETSRLPHAILIAGPKGIGRTSFVKALAQFLLCQKPTDTACGECRSCHLFNLKSHPDLIIYGEEETIHIDEIREIAPFLAHRSHFGGKKIVCLFNVDFMQKGAANALLKMLEEPSDETHFLLSAENMSRLLPTIKSRCVIYTQGLPEHAFALQWLKEHSSSTNASLLETVLTLAGGAPKEALKILNEGSDIKWQEEVVEEFTTKAALSQALLSKVQDQGQMILRYLGFWVADGIRAHYGLAPLLQGASTNALKLPIKRLFTFYDHIQTALKTLQQTPALNKQLLFEYLFYEWIKLQGRG